MSLEDARLKLRPPQTNLLVTAMPQARPGERKKKFPSIRQIRAAKPMKIMVRPQKRLRERPRNLLAQCE